ncbi:MAG: nicotinate phosphoribosyltransferase, partial [Mycolicibacterium aromaticivorans]|nr:nicotinate phosphoribosyltransferase [Mycolicibacterium aromaticivorans]
IPVQKRSSRKESHGGRKAALRLSRPSGTITEEVIHPMAATPEVSEPSRVLTVPLVRAGQPLASADLAAARELVVRGLRSLPWEGLALSAGEPAIPTRQVPVRSR